MAEKDKDIDNDVTAIIFQAFKKAEPIIVLASISLAIGALVASQNKYLTIYKFSVISSFMFIFSFGFYILYELYKKYLYPTKELEPDESSFGIFYYNMIRFAPIYLVSIGIIFLIIIAYEFGLDSTGLQAKTLSSKSSLPILPLVWLFFISYFFGYTIYSIIKNLIRWRKTHDIRTRNFISYLLTASAFFTVLLAQELYILALIGFPQFFNNQDFLRYSMYILIIAGIVGFVKDILRTVVRFRRLKRKYATIVLIISIPILLSIPLAIEWILKGLGVLDKRFDIFEYAINASRNVLPHANQSKTTSFMNHSHEITSFKHN